MASNGKKTIIVLDDDEKVRERIAASLLRAVYAPIIAGSPGAFVPPYLGRFSKPDAILMSTSVGLEPSDRSLLARRETEPVI